MSIRTRAEDTAFALRLYGFDIRDREGGNFVAMLAEARGDGEWGWDWPGVGHRSICAATYRELCDLDCQPTNEHPWWNEWMRRAARDRGMPFA